MALASEEVMEFLIQARGNPAYANQLIQKRKSEIAEESRAPEPEPEEEIPSAERCREILLTTDGLGKSRKTVALYYLIAHERANAPSVGHSRSVLESYRKEIARLQRELDARPSINTSEPIISPPQGELSQRAKAQIQGLKAENLSLKKRVDNMMGELGLTEDRPNWKRNKIAACFYCGEVMLNPTKDHFIPISSGGVNLPFNLVAACTSCNSAKSSKLPTEAQIRKYFALWKQLGIDLTQFIGNETIPSRAEVSDSCV